MGAVKSEFVARIDALSDDELRLNIDSGIYRRHNLVHAKDALRRREAAAVSVTETRREAREDESLSIAKIDARTSERALSKITTANILAAIATLIAAIATYIAYVALANGHP